MHCGGVQGAVISVSNMDKAISFYSTVLSSDEEVYNKKGVFQDMPGEHSNNYHRVLLRKITARCGAFSKLLGHVEIELVQSLNADTRPAYQNRYWGDCGFIHLCFDVINMDALKRLCEKAGYKFTVDSQLSFILEQAAGRFCYVEDPDGTLIELVETHKVPVLKKLDSILI